MKISCRLKLSKCQQQDMHSAQRNQDELIFGGGCKAKCYKCLLGGRGWGSENWVEKRCAVKAGKRRQALVLTQA